MAGGARAPAVREGMKTITLTDAQASLIRSCIEFARENAGVSSYEEIGVWEGSDEEAEAELDGIERQL